MSPRSKQRCLLVLSMGLLLMLPAPEQYQLLAQPVSVAESEKAAKLIGQMKQQRRGPFSRIRWFCHDGTILPPKPYACRGHGGGNQHGLWSGQTRWLRNHGYLVANILAAVDGADFIGSEPQLNRLKQLLLERYLMRVDDGWVFRKARFYRGAVQQEDEKSAARVMVLAMLADPDWLQASRFLLLRETVRLLPVGLVGESAAFIRQSATDIAQSDLAFQALRVKIHSQPDGRDGAAVRAYATLHGLPKLKPAYAALAERLDQLYAPKTFLSQLKKLAVESTNRRLKHELNHAAEEISKASDVASSMAVVATLSQSWRYMIEHDQSYTVYNRLRLLRASLLVEEHAYVLGNQLLTSLPTASRQQRLDWLVQLGRALQGAGLIPDLLWSAAELEVTKLRRHTAVSATAYQNVLTYLTRVSQWSEQTLAFQFAPTVKQWRHLTPLSITFIPARLRASPLLPFTRVLDELIHDLQLQTWVSQEMFGQQVAGALRALNPGVSQGILLKQPKDLSQMRSDGIYILQSTVHMLPPVAGIITRGEGSSLSHVQLLARNMGIPNLVASDRALRLLTPYLGKRIEMAISQRGVISIAVVAAKDAAVTGAEPLHAAMHIDIDPSRLQLQDDQLRSLSQIRAKDAGRSVGPKAANLAELMHLYPDKVSAGIVIPFAVFRKHLAQPLYDGGPELFVWMKSMYQYLNTIHDRALRKAQTTLFLEQLRDWLRHSQLDPRFSADLRLLLKQKFGDDGSYGLFVRSDTNVEDLPGFSGAGLNLTVPNVVGFDAIVTALLRVWASPFSERAYAWRQSHMQQPEQLFPSVLLMQSVPSEVSGVMVTRDVDSGASGWLSIAVNQGVGGAVDGQSAEELRVRRQDGHLRLLSLATAAERITLSAQGGIIKKAVIGQARLLNAAALSQLRLLADDVEKRFPLPHQANGAPVAADIEFGFVDGALQLFQIRPFVESARAKQSLHLQAMDARLPDITVLKIDLNRSPLP
ncbi:MAG: PEP/pyruvate-binding domain-containing protein [Mariprofundus sp.]|nr:PEP/pyruvate-binding domain-containing protein [Mariprofundus sp.]